MNAVKRPRLVDVADSIENATPPASAKPRSETAYLPVLVTAPKEAREYIRRLISLDVGQAHLQFSDRAVQRVDEIAAGDPFYVEMLCDRALQVARRDARLRVERSEVELAALELFQFTPSAVQPLPPGGTAPHKRRRLLPKAALLLVFSSFGFALANLAIHRSPHSDVPITPVLKADDPKAVASANAAKDAALQPVAQATPKVGPHLEGNSFRSEAEAWRELGSLWGESLPPGEPCAEAQRLSLQCYRATRLSADDVRKIDRPGLITLSGTAPPSGMALLTAISAETATLQSGAQTWTLPLASMLERWQGDFSTLWRLPMGQLSRVVDGRNGSTAGWLTQSIAALQAAGDVPASGPQITERVRAFQLAHGINGAGVAGPLTLMHLNRAVGVEEPRLLNPQL